MLPNAAATTCVANSAFKLNLGKERLSCISSGTSHVHRSDGSLFPVRRESNFSEGSR